MNLKKEARSEKWRGLGKERGGGGGDEKIVLKWIGLSKSLSENSEWKDVK